MKIITDMDACRRYVCETKLYDFDILDHALRPDVKLDFVNPVPVYSENRRGAPIGYADVFVDENKVKATLFIDYASPERLMMEIGEWVYVTPDGDFSVTSRNEVDALWIPHVMFGTKEIYEGIGGRCLPT